MDSSEVENTLELKPHDGEYIQQNNTGFSENHDTQAFDTTLGVKIKTEDTCSEFAENKATLDACFGVSTHSVLLPEYSQCNPKAEVHVKAETTPLLQDIMPGNIEDDSTNIFQGDLISQTPTGTFECPYCERETTQLHFLRMHMRLAHNPNGEPFKCESCDYETIDKRRLTKHVRHHRKRAKINEENAEQGRVDDESEEEDEAAEDMLVDSLELADQKDSDFYQCPYCSYETKSLNALSTHKNYAHKENGELFRCDQCPYESSDKRKLTRHVRIFHKTEVLSCERCNYQTRDKALLAAHLGDEHSDLPATHSCRFCPFTTTDHDQLKEHVFASHEERAESSMFTCQECGLQTPSAVYLRAHQRAKHPHSSDGEDCDGSAADKRAEDELLTCPDCPYHTRDRDYLEQHVLAKHGRPLKPYRCDKCGYTARLQRQMTRHVRFKHEDSTALYQCKMCHFKTKDKYYFEKHLKFVHGEALPMYNCTECSFQSKYRAHLGRHVRVNHTSDGKVFQCERCSYATHNKSHLQTHVKNIHEYSGEMHSCEQCDYKSKMRSSLRRHVAEVHEGKVPVRHPCQLCDFSTRSVRSLNRHVLTRHTDSRPQLACDHCSYSSPDKSNLARHVRRVHTTDGQPKPCPHCPHQSRNIESLRVHVRKHHPQPGDESLPARKRNRPPGKRLCRQCPFVAADADQLREHVVREHRETTLYQCAACPFVTKVKYYLRTHYRHKHDRGEEFRCTQCDFVTANESYYKQHVKIKHAAIRKVWVCPFCQLESFYKTGIKRHLLAIHKDQFEAFATEEKRKSHVDVLIANAFVIKETDADTDLQSGEGKVKIEVKEEYVEGCSDGDYEKDTEDFKYGNIIDGDTTGRIDAKTYRKEGGPNIDGDQSIDGDDSESYNHNDEENVNNKDHLKALLIKGEDNMEVDQPEYVTIEKKSHQADVSVSKGLLCDDNTRVKIEVKCEDDVDSQFN